MKPLIAPKHISEFGPEEFHTYVSSMFGMRIKGKAKPLKVAPGLTVNRNKKGALSIRRAKSRPLAYITHTELTALAQELKVPQAELWNAFKAKDYIISKSRMEAEQIYAKLKELPWS